MIIIWDAPVYLTLGPPMKITVGRDGLNESLSSNFELIHLEDKTERGLPISLSKINV